MDRHNLMSNDIQFKCPKCGSFMYGSSLNSDGTWTRHCHGNEMWLCDLTFHESDDDKYFIKSKDGEKMNVIYEVENETIEGQQQI